MPRPSHLAVVTVVAAASALATPAQAFEDRLTLGVELGAAFVVIPETTLPCCGALVGVESSIGLDDVFSLRGHLAYALHPGDETLHVGLLGVELLYLLDVVEAVPFFGLGVDGIGSLFQGAPTIELGAHLTVGLSYLLSRDALVAIDVRAHYLPLSIDERVEPVYITANARYSVMFEL